MLRLEMLRKEMGLSQLDLAKKLNMTQQRISAYEKSKREPDIETLKLFADFFDVSVDYFLGKTNQRSSESIELSDIDIAFASGVKGLNDTNKQIAKQLVEGLLAKQKEEENNNKRK